MSAQLFAFPPCVIPGCRNPVATVGEPCQPCRTAFGPLLIENPDAPLLTADEIAARDCETDLAYARRRMVAS
jgi:hypothetical protein